MRLFLSLLLGMLPEVLYFTLFIINVKSIKEKKFRLFFLVAIAYCLCLFIQKWQVLYYIALIVIMYIIMKLLYKEKTQIIDIFIVSLMCLWTTFLSFIMLLLLKDDYSNYWTLYTFDRILLYAPFVFKSKFNVIYKKYCKLWNRNDNEIRPIKSITLRNISLILLNCFIFFMNITLINMINHIR